MPSERQASLFAAEPGRTTDQRLLILSCSERKSPAIRPIPAVDRYDGPAFRVLRRFREHELDNDAQLDVLVVSAKHGLIDGAELLVNYDERITERTRDELRRIVLAQLSERKLNYQDVLVVATRTYAKVIEGIEDYFSPNTTFRRTDGPRGKQLAQLRNWLTGRPLGVYMPEQRFPRRGIARLKGIEKSLSPAQLVDQARMWLRQDIDSGQLLSDRFVDRYVLIDERRVAPKWLVGRLFDLPVSSFETPDARRVLEQLGLRVYSLKSQGTNGPG